MAMEAEEEMVFVYVPPQLKARLHGPPEEDDLPSMTLLSRAKAEDLQRNNPRAMIIPSNKSATPLGSDATQVHVPDAKSPDRPFTCG